MFFLTCHIKTINQSKHTRTSPVADTAQDDDDNSRTDKNDPCPPRKSAGYNPTRQHTHKKKHDVNKCFPLFSPKKEKKKKDAVLLNRRRYSTTSSRLDSTTRVKLFWSAVTVLMSNFAS